MSSPVALTRRRLLERMGGGIAQLGFAGLLAREARPATAAAPARPGPHFVPKAKHVISIFCYGGPSQVDTFDPKPDLAKYAGQAMGGVGETFPGLVGWAT